MGRLEDRLHRIREGAKERIPDDAREVMHRATRRLEESGAAERAVGAGQRAPAFTLPDSDGEPVSLRDLLDEGPAVLAFFRGHW